jgi:hypothetical protein
MTLVIAYSSREKVFKKINFVQVFFANTCISFILILYSLVKLQDAIDQRFTRLDPNTVQQSSQLLELTHQSLLAIIQQ